MHSFHASPKTTISPPFPVLRKKSLLEDFSCHPRQNDGKVLLSLVFDQKQADGLKLKSLLQQNPVVDAFLSLYSSVTFLLDVKSNTYLYLSANIDAMLGYSASDLQKSELTANAVLIHAEDSFQIDLFTTKLFKRLKKIPLQKLSDYTLHREYRLLRKDGSSIGLLEQSKVVESNSSGEVITLFGQLTDVSILKKKHGPAAYLTSTGNQEVIDFTPKKSSAILSNRELQVMELLSKGLSSKQIAHMLSISYYTVGKHRQKMLAKTHSKNSSELIHFAEHNQLV